jgi:hypothetical protein
MYDTSKIPEKLWVPLHHLQCSSELREVLGTLIQSSNNFDEGSAAIVSSELALEAHDKARNLYPVFKEMGVKATFRHGAFDDEWGYIALVIEKEKASNIDLKSLGIWLQRIYASSPDTIHHMCIVIG